MEQKQSSSLNPAPQTESLSVVFRSGLHSWDSKIYLKTQSVPVTEWGAPTAPSPKAHIFRNDTLKEVNIKLVSGSILST